MNKPSSTSNLPEIAALKRKTKISGTKRVTIRDIAVVAGVTPATVSYVLSGSRKVKISEGTQRRVRDIAERLGYMPDMHARSLVTGRTMTLGISFGGTGEAPFSDDYDRHILHGLVRGTALANYALQVLAQPFAMGAYSVDGWIAVQAPADFDRAVLGPKPVVFLDPAQPMPGEPCVWARNAEAGALLAGLLLPEKGGVLFALHDVLERSPFSYRERLRGFGEQALAMGGQRVVHSHVDPLDADALRRWMGVWSPRFLSGEIKHLVCVSDMLAARLLRLLTESGIRVPEDVELAGFDNTLHSQLSHPAISTVEVGAGDLAALAVEILASRINGKECSSQPVAPLWIPRETHLGGSQGVFNPVV